MVFVMDDKNLCPNIYLTCPFTIIQYSSYLSIYLWFVYIYLSKIYLHLSIYLRSTVNYPKKNRFLQRTEREFQCANSQSDSDKNLFFKKRHAIRFVIFLWTSVMCIVHVTVFYLYIWFSILYRVDVLSLRFLAEIGQLGHVRYSDYRTVHADSALRTIIALKMRKWFPNSFGSLCLRAYI